MPFNEAAYEQEVIRPLRDRRGGLQPDEDLIARYAIGPECSDPGRLRDHLRTIRSYWNQKATGRDRRSVVCRMLIAADDQLQRTPGADLENPAWWQGATQRREQLLRQTITQLAADLGSAYPRGGQITQAQLAAIAMQYPSLGTKQIADALKQAKLHAVDDVDLPTASGLDRTAYRTLGEKLAEIGDPTIVQLLHPGPIGPFTLLTKFSVTGRPNLALDAAALQTAISASEVSADSPVLRARKAALGLLRTGLANGADLRTIALYQIVEDLCEAKATRLTDVLLVRKACQLGLEQRDAERVVASLPMGGEATTTVTPTQRIRDHIEAGELRAAQQALAALSPADPEHADMRALVDAAHTRVERLVRDATTALDAHHEDEAVRLLDEAIRIAKDDDDLVARRATVPSAPPREVSAAEVNGTVQLSWSAPNPVIAGVRYRVVRTEDRQSTGPHDGVEITTATDTRATDSNPPVAARLRYAIYATGDGKQWSRPVHTEALVTPPIAGITMRVDEDRVVASWKRHPAAVAVRVRRTIDRPPKSPTEGTAVDSTLDSFVDRSIEAGIDYYYSFVAVYRNGRHQEIPAEMAIASATPRAPGAAVDGLTVTPISVNGRGGRVRIAWPTVPGTPVRLRYAERRPAWEFGETIPLAKLESYGQEVVGSPVADAGETFIETDVPGGQHVYVAFAIGGTGAVVGRSVAMGVIEPVRQLSAQRLGAEAVLSWVWPDGVALVELVWMTAEHGAQTRRITKASMVSSGCRVPVGASGGTARISSIAVGHVGEATSPAVTIVVDGRPLSITYRIERPTSLRKLLSRQRFLHVQADSDCLGVNLVVVASSAVAMPLRPDQGTVVTRYEGLVLGAGQRETFDIEVPEGIRRPYWLRCFVTAPENATVVDPPIDNLKVER